MKLTRAVCTTCGANVDVNADSKKGKCEACGNTYVVSHAMDLQKIEVDKTKDLRNYRILLSQAVENADYETMRNQAKGVLEILPNDFKAQYFFAFASKKRHSPKALERFYKGRHYEATEEAINEVVNHIIENSDLSDYSLIVGFITYIAQGKLERYEEYFRHRRKLEENYSMIPRDAFICHRSRDRREAEAVVNALERDGYACWASFRNLRPNDNENYWKNIEAAIENCKVFLVVASNDAMLSKDVQREMEVADKLKKPKLEFKIDDTEHTSLFKHFFDGHKWIDASTDVKKAFAELKERFYQMMEELRFSNVKKYKDKGRQPTKLENLVRRAQLSLSHNDFQQAIESAEDALDLNVESSEAWSLKFLAEHKFSSNKDFIDFIQGSDDLESVIEISDSKDFLMARKLSENPKTFNDILQIVKDRIDDYADTVSLEDEDAMRILQSIVDHRADHDLARFKLFLFRKRISGPKAFEALVTDEKRFFEAEAIIKSDDFKSLMDDISDESLHRYEEMFGSLEESLGEKNIVRMRKLRTKRNTLVHTIENHMRKKQFKKAARPIKKLYKLGKEYKEEALSLSLMCQHHIRGKEHLNHFIKRPSNHLKIKAMIHDKRFKSLEKCPGSEEFVKTIKDAYHDTFEALKVNKLKQKIAKVKERYRTWYSFNHFLIGILLFAMGGMIYASLSGMDVFGTVDHHTALGLSEILLSLILFIMILTLFLRELAFFKTKRIERRLDEEDETESPPLMYLFSPLVLIIFMVLLTESYFRSLWPIYNTHLNEMIDSQTALFLLSGSVLALLILYSALQKRSEKIHKKLKSARSLRKMLIRPVLLIIVLLIFFESTY